jgi:hypothetical protein
MINKFLLGMLAVAISLTCSAQSYKTQWEAEPGKMLYHLIFGMKGKVVSTDAISWPDGRSATIQYIKTDATMYKCVDFYNGSFQETGNMCYRLKKWPST